MREQLADRIQKMVRAIGEASPEPPPFPSGQQTPARHSRIANRSTAVVALISFATVAAVASLAALLLRGPEDQLMPASTAPAQTVLVLHQVFEYRQTADLSCVGDVVSESGEFDSMTIELWSDREGRRFRQQITYPDGSTRDVIALGHPIYPREAYARGKPGGRTIGCGGFENLLYDPSDSIGVLTFNLPLEPVPLGYTELGAQVVGDHTDSEGRPSDLYEEVMEGSIGEGEASRPLSQTTSWYVNPDTGDVLEVAYRQTIDQVGTVSRTTTLVSQGEAVVAEALFDVDGYTLIADESSYGLGRVEGRPTDPATRLGPDWIWPETPDRSGPTAVATRFAVEVLGWDQATAVADPQALPDSPTWVTIRDGSGLSVAFLTYPTGGGWAANQIGRSTSGGVGPEGSVMITVDPPTRATSVMIMVGTADNTLAWEAEVASDTRSVTLPGMTLDAKHTTLILFSDDEGNIIGADGGQSDPPRLTP